MGNRRTVDLPTPFLLHLQDHLRLTGSKLSTEQAIIHAVEQWQTETAKSPSGPAAEPGYGYQWKELFLPHATRLRMIYLGTSYYAEVVGDSLRFKGRALSPRQMVMAVTGSVRNPWLELFIRFPLARDWKRAKSCLLQQRQEEASRVGRVPATPGESLAATAAAMSDALKTTLALVAHTRAASAPKTARRLEKNRRESDLFKDDCPFDPAHAAS